MTKRIFVAIPICEELQALILEWEKKWPGLPVRWLKGPNLHVTLVPPWEEENVEVAIEKLKAAQNFGQFIIKFDLVRYGPTSESPRLIWAEGTVPKEAVLLKESMEEVFNNKSDYRPWILHLTLARFNTANFKNFGPQKLDESVDWSQEVSSVVLMESVRTTTGTDYQILSIVDLKQSHTASP